MGDKQYIVVYAGDPAYPYSGRAAARWDATSKTWQYILHDARVRTAISPATGPWPSDATALRRVALLYPTAQVTWSDTPPVAPPV